MSDYVTILKSAQRGRLFAKLFNGKTASPPKYPTWHSNGQVSIKNLKGFYKKVYKHFSSSNDCCILRDKCVPDTENEDICRIVRGKQQIRRKRGNFKDVGHNWVMFDIDKAYSDVNWKKYPEEAVIDVVKTYLPEEFHDSQFVWAYSGSQGLGKEGLNLHIVFWMSRKVTNAEWRGWFDYHGFEKDDPVDQSVFRPNQIHIIADPKLVNTSDPFKKTKRAGFYKKGSASVEFNMDLSYVDTPKQTPVKEGNMFDDVRGYNTPIHIKTFNALIDAHDLLIHYGYKLAAGDPRGKACDEEAQCRYLHPRSESGSAGTGLMRNGEIHSFADNDVLNIGRYVDTWTAYIILETNEIETERGTAEVDEDDGSFGFNENDEVVADVEALLEELDESDDLRRMCPPAILAESRARRLSIMGGLRYMNERYFSLETQQNSSLFKYIDLGEQAGGWRLAAENKDKYAGVMSQFTFLDPRLEFVPGGGTWEFSGGVKDIIKLYTADPNKRNYTTTGIFFGKARANVFDMWRGYSIKPEGDVSECKLFLDHLLNIICKGRSEDYEFLLDLFAGWFQGPAIRWGVVPVFVGGEGTGKGSVMQVIMSLYDTSNVLQTSDLQTVLGRFNLTLANKVVVFLDDISFEKAGANSDRSGKLKTLISENTMEVEPKGQESFKVPNCVHIGIASNDREKAVPATADSRRYFIVEVSDCKANDVEYFELFYDTVGEAKFKGALLKFFMDRKITHNLRMAPKTDKLLDMAVNRVDHVTKWLIEMCELDTPIPYHEFNSMEMHLGDMVDKDILWESYEAFCETMNIRDKMTLSHLGKKLKENGFTSIRKGNREEGRRYFYRTPEKSALVAQLKYKTDAQIEEEEFIEAEELLLGLES